VGADIIDTNGSVQSGIEYVSRGGQKLEKALDFFKISPEDKVCIDCGASTGGFTDCLLNRGAKLIYAIDVGYGQLAWKLRNDERVITMERTNIRYVTTDMFKIKPEFAVIDVSFISLALVLPVIRELLTEPGEVVSLIKPQFEAGRGKVGKKGVVRDPQIHKEVLDAFIENAGKSGFTVKDLTYSPVKGPKGNIEFLGLLGADDKQNKVGDNVVIDTKKLVFESHKELAG